MPQVADVVFSASKIRLYNILGGNPNKRIAWTQTFKNDPATPPLLGYFMRHLLQSFSLNEQLLMLADLVYCASEEWVERMYHYLEKTYPDEVKRWRACPWKPDKVRVSKHLPQPTEVLKNVDDLEIYNSLLKMAVADYVVVARQVWDNATVVGLLNSTYEGASAYAWLLQELLKDLSTDQRRQLQAWLETKQQPISPSASASASPLPTVAQHAQQPLDSVLPPVNTDEPLAVSSHLPPHPLPADDPPPVRPSTNVSPFAEPLHVQRENVLIQRILKLNQDQLQRLHADAVAHLGTVNVFLGVLLHEARQTSESRRTDLARGFVCGLRERELRWLEQWLQRHP